MILLKINNYNQMKNIYLNHTITKKIKLGSILILALTYTNILFAQTIDNNGCVGGNFGIDAGLYSGLIEFGDGTPAAGTTDWFQGPSGRGTIDETNPPVLTGGGNPTYEQRMSNGLSSILDGQILIDAVWSRDRFGGTGYYDYSSFETASKNGEDPAIWDLGQSNVLGKNDLIDVAGHMLRDGTGLTSDLWFFGLINRAEPGGSAYMDFEFFVEDVWVNAAPVAADPGEGTFTSGGPQLGHTAFTFDQTTGEILSVGDFIFNVSLIDGGEEASVEMRLWVSYADYTSITPATGFTWGPEYDGAFNGSPYGYASIIPASSEICGIVNLDLQNPAAPPWGTIGTKTNTYGTSYIDFAVVEVGLNMSAFGVDHASLSGSDPCSFPINTFIVKTRASASFTAQLKDYAGPYSWGQPSVSTTIIDSEPLSCLNPEVTLSAAPIRNDVDYLWTTVDGNIIGDPTAPTINVNLPGTYALNTTLPTTCAVDESSVTIGFDPDKPFFNEPTATTTIACNGNDGTIDLTVTGGTEPYTFAWSTGATSEDLTGLAPGNYSVEITDAIGCNIISDDFIVEAKTLTTITEVVTDADCYGSSTGAINITATGKPPYTYSWSNGSSLEDIAGLAAGDYTVIATDSVGCTTEAIFTVNQPDEIVLSISKTDETASELDNGTINLTVVSGGTPDYTYAWTGTDGYTSTIDDLTGLAAGVYTVIVTDANGCTAEISATILEPEICFDGIDNDGDGLTDCFDPDCTVSSPGAISASSNPVCVGDVDVIYSIASTGADTYTWTVPAGASITEQTDTGLNPFITVSWVSNIGGQICVIATIDGCQSEATCFTVQLDDVPPPAGTINVNN